MKLCKGVVLGLDEIEEIINERLVHISGIESIEVYIYDNTNLEVIICLALDDKDLARQVCLSLGNHDVDKFYENNGIVRIFGKDIVKGLFIDYTCDSFYPKDMAVCFVVEDISYTEKLMKLITFAAGKTLINLPVDDDDEGDHLEDERMDILHELEYPVAETVVELMKENNMNKEDISGDTLSECIWEILSYL